MSDHLPPPTPPAGPNGFSGSDERLMRIEESIAFGDHALESLTAQMLELDGRLRRLLARLERVEARLSAMDEPGQPGLAGEGDSPIP